MWNAEAITGFSNGAQKRRPHSGQAPLPKPGAVSTDPSGFVLWVLMWQGSTTVGEYVLSPTYSIVPEASEQTAQDAIETSVAFHSNFFPFDPQQDQQSHVVSHSQLKSNSDVVSLDTLNTHHEPEVDQPLAYTLPDDEEEDCIDDLDIEAATTVKSCFSLESSPTFDDMLLQSGNIDVTNSWHGPLVYPYQDHDMLDPFNEGMDDEIEEIDDGGRLSHHWPMAYPSPSPSESSSSSNGSMMTLSTLHKRPNLNPFGTEMLIARFASETCGILSIKDGQNENPWRTMLLPMSLGVPALHHAILCLSAFHASRQDKRFRIAGLKHMQKSIHFLSNQLGTMRRDVALATTLVLAFSESWNEETSTGIRHLKAARTLVTQAVANNSVDADLEELERLKFLRNTWVYMDVIARITAADCDDLENLDSLFAPVYGPEGQNEELDPLMGCASRLFPLIGDVANLVREIRRLTSTSPRIVSRAADLKVKILKWRAPPHLRVPQDESIEVAHALNTAEAYRWSAVLFLFQAVPMIATEAPAVLAEKILYHLVSVPLTSRVTIIQIFPLLVAGCEMTSEDNRMLVKDRWASMTSRMTIGNLDRCSDVVDEVWARRDKIGQLTVDENDRAAVYDVVTDELPFPLRRGSTLSSTASRPSIVRPDQLYRQASEGEFDVDRSVTVRGYGHWLTVMEDWNWAGKTYFRHHFRITH